MTQYIDTSDPKPIRQQAVVPNAAVPPSFQEYFQTAAKSDQIKAAVMDPDTAARSVVQLMVKYHHLNPNLLAIHQDAAALTTAAAFALQERIAALTSEMCQSHVSAGWSDLILSEQNLDLAAMLTLLLVRSQQ
jgi:hypothetical protein